MPLHLVPIVLVSLLVGGGAYAFTASLSPVTTSSSPLFDYVVTIVMENDGLNDTYGSHCLGNCTYITELADQYSLARNYSSVLHDSLPNYLTLTSGGNFSRAPFNRDCYPENQTTGCYITGLNLIDNLTTVNRSWKAYMEDYKGGCTLSALSNDYVENHNPFVYYTDIYSNSTRCSRIVDANPGATGFLALPTQLFSDLNSTSTASNYMWLSPNLCDNGHDQCQPVNNRVSQANLYLSMVVPRILSSKIFTTQNAALFVTWDEPSGVSNYVVTSIWAGPAVKLDYKSNISYTHYSAVKTIETAWGLPSLYPEDAAAASMSEFFASGSLTGGGGGAPREYRLSIGGSF